jgi:flagellin
MANNVVLSSGVRQNLLSLQSIADVMNTTQTRLASGKKVNNPLDNAVNFFTSAGLESRAGDLGALLDAMSNAIQTVNTANHGITSIVTTIQSMQSTLMQARQDATWQTKSYTLDTAAIGTAALKNISFAGGATTASPLVALNVVGSNGTKASQDFANAYAPPLASTKAIYVGNGAYTSGAGAATIQITYTPTSATAPTAPITMQVAVQTAGNTITTEAEVVDAINAAILLDANFNGKVNATMNGGAIQIETLTAVDANLTVAGTTAVFGAAFSSTAGSNGLTQFTVNGTTVTLSNITAGVQDSANLTSAVNTANLQLLLAGSQFEAYENPVGPRFGIRERNAQGATLTLAGADASLFTGGTTVAGVASTNGSVKTVDQLASDINAAYAGFVKASNDGGKLQIQNISTTDLTVTGANSTSVTGASTSTIGGNSARKSLVAQFNQFIDQLNKFAADSSFNGINLLQGDVLRVVFNSQSTSTLDIVARDASGNPFVVNATNLGISVVTNVSFDSNTSIDNILNSLTESLKMARSQSSGFGANLSIVQNRQDFTKQMISTLKTGADNLVVADTNEEGANMLALQTRQQLSIAALSLANQANQSVLRLFG